MRNAMKPLGFALWCMSVTLPTAVSQSFADPIPEEESGVFPTKFLMEIAEQRKTLLSETVVRFAGSYDENVPANLFRPKYISDQSRLPAILLQYGLTGNRNSDYVVFHAAKLALKGFVVIVTDGPGIGKDRMPLPEGESAASQIEQYLYDYQKALEYVAKLNFVDAERIGYAGISWGGITGITFAANEPRVKATIALGAGGNLPNIDPKLDPAAHVAKFEKRNLMLINGRLDTIINPIFSLALHNKAPKDTLKLWLNTNHYFSGYDHNLLNDHLSEFLFDRLVED